MGQNEGEKMEQKRVKVRRRKDIKEERGNEIKHMLCKLNDEGNEG